MKQLACLCLLITIIHFNFIHFLKGEHAGSVYPRSSRKETPIYIHAYEILLQAKQATWGLNERDISYVLTVPSLAIR